MTANGICYLTGKMTSNGVCYLTGKMTVNGICYVTGSTRLWQWTWTMTTSQCMQPQRRLSEWLLHYLLVKRCQRPTWNSVNSTLMTSSNNWWIRNPTDSSPVSTASNFTFLPLLTGSLPHICAVNISVEVTFVAHFFLLTIYNCFSSRTLEAAGCEWCYTFLWSKPEMMMNVDKNETGYLDAKVCIYCIIALFNLYTVLRKNIHFCCLA